MHIMKKQAFKLLAPIYTNFLITFSMNILKYPHTLDFVEVWLKLWFSHRQSPIFQDLLLKLSTMVDFSEFKFLRKLFGHFFFYLSIEIHTDDLFHRKIVKNFTYSLEKMDYKLLSIIKVLKYLDGTFIQLCLEQVLI